MRSCPAPRTVALPEQDPHHLFRSLSKLGGMAGDIDAKNLKNRRKFLGEIHAVLISGGH